MSSKIKLCKAFSVIISMLFLFLINVGFGTKSFNLTLSLDINLFLVFTGSLSNSLDLILNSNSLTDKHLFITT